MRQVDSFMSYENRMLSENVAFEMHCNLRPRRALVVLPLTETPVEVGQPVRCCLITFILLIVTLHCDLDLCSLTLTFDI